MEGSEKKGEGKTVFWRVWEKLWWVFAPALIGGMGGVYLRYGGVGLIKLWASVFACMGAALTVHGWWARRLAAWSVHWFPTEARVLRSEVCEEVQSSFSREGIHPSYQTVSYYPEVEYEYEVQGERRRSNKVLLVHVHHSAEEARAVVAKYPTGATVRAWYDPGAPDRVVLEPGLQGRESKYRIPLGVGLAFLALGMFVWAVLKWRGL